MDETAWNDICAAHDLGLLAGTPQAVQGGLQHHLFRVHTARGAYAIKILNPRLLAEPGRRERLERAERIAQAAAEAGLPAVPALLGPDGLLLTTGNVTAMVFPWHSGSVLPPTPARPSAARQIGSLMGRLHTLRLTVPEDATPPTTDPANPDWLALVRQAQIEQVPWAERLSAALPDLLDWDQAAQKALMALRTTPVLTHRDMDQKNVLWADSQTPWLLDWEDAGPMNPMQEVMGAALNWAGLSAGPPAHATFIAFLHGYSDVAAIDGAALRHAAVAVLDKWLVWLAFNMRRSLAEFGASPAEQQLACGTVDHSLATLKTLAADTDTRLRWCDAAQSRR